MVKKKYRVVIIGAGIMGLATAYHLAQRGITDVLIVDRAYLCGGASGRNGGGVRAQFSSETNIRLMQESIEICKSFAAKMKINVWFRQGGYLFLTRTQERARGLEASVKLQNECGLPTRLLEPSEIQSIVPEIDPSGVVRASFNPDDGVVFPWPFVWGYAKAAKDLGVEIETYTDVIDFVTKGNRITGVVLRKTRHDEIAGWDRLGPTDARGDAPPSFTEMSRHAGGERTTIECDDVLLCTGAWSPEVARLVGVELPNHPHRHEICSTEPLKPWLGPLVAELGGGGLYFSQSARGEIVGGIGVDPVPPGINQRSSLEFLATYSRALVRTVPKLATVKVLRQWAGCYDLTPDSNPIVGRVGKPENLVLACGFMGHGFMIAPVMGKLLAEHVETGVTSELFARWALARFREGRLLEERMIIG
jgi:sarcosine oxidase subunit beta